MTLENLGISVKERGAKTTDVPFGRFNLDILSREVAFPAQ